MWYDTREERAKSPADIWEREDNMREKKLWILLLMLLPVLLSGCGGKRAETPAGEADVSVGAAPSNLRVLLAQDFDIQYLADGVKLVTDSAGRELLLTPRGAAAPAGYDGAAKISTPIRRAMFTSEVYVGFLEALEEPGLYDSIAALTLEAGQWTSQAVADRFAGGQIAYIPPETWLAGDAEALTAADLDLVFLDLSHEEDAALAQLLDQAGIPYVSAFRRPEGDTEAYLEWLKFFAAFYDLDQEAGGLWEETLSRLDALYSQQEFRGKRPVAAVCTVSGGTVCAPAGGSAIAKQLERAGAVYALAEQEGRGTVQMEMEEFLELCKDADVLLYSALPQDLADSPPDPLLAECRAYQNGRVFTLDSGYYMHSAQVVARFEDLVAMCWPEREKDHVFTMYQPLAE